MAAKWQRLMPDPAMDSAGREPRIRRNECLDLRLWISEGSYAKYAYAEQTMLFRKRQAESQVFAALRQSNGVRPQYRRAIRTWLAVSSPLNTQQQVECGYGEVDAADTSGYDCDAGREPATRMIEFLRHSLPAVKDRSLLKPTTSRARTRAQATKPRLTVISPRRVEMRRKMVARAFDADDKHAYFESVAEARYVLRKVFRIVEEQAKSADLDPLAHQALIQIYGSPRMELRVNELADRLDIAPAFASNLASMLVAKRLLSRTRAQHDQRVIIVRVTDAGRKLLHTIDAQVKVHVDLFARILSPKEREAALSILMFYVGATMSTHGE